MRHGAHLQADGQIDPGAEGGADGPRRQAQVFEKLGEGLREREAGSLLSHHHTASHTRQVETPSLKHTHSSRQGVDRG